MSAAAYEQDNGYQSLQLVLQEEFGIVIGDERRPRLIARLGPVLEQFAITDIHSLVDKLRDKSVDALRDAVLLAITSYESAWFVPSEMFAVLADYVLPGLIEKRVPRAPRARFWVIGCGNGALPYSVSMAVAEAQIKAGRELAVDIVTTEITTDTLALAKQALYDSSSMKHLDENRMHRYMTAEGEHFRVNDDIRARVSFSTCNLLDDITGMGHFDVIICLDTLMYYSLAIKRSILEAFSGLLDPSGILLVGANESVIPLSRKFDRVEIAGGVFYRQKS